MRRSPSTRPPTCSPATPPKPADRPTTPVSGMRPRPLGRTTYPDSGRILRTGGRWIPGHPWLASKRTQLNYRGKVDRTRKRDQIGLLGPDCGHLPPVEGIAPVVPDCHRRGGVRVADRKTGFQDDVLCPIDSG